MKLRTKMLLISSITLLLFSIALGLAIFGLQNTTNRFNHFIHHDQEALRAEFEMYTYGLQVGQALRNIVLDPNNHETFETLIQAQDDFDAALSKAEQLAYDDDAKLAGLEEVRVLNNRRNQLVEEVMTYALAIQGPAATELLVERETPTWRQMRSVLLDNIENQDLITHKILKENRHLDRLITHASLVVGTLALVFGAALLFWLTRSILRQLGGDPAYAVKIAHEVSKGNFTENIMLHTGDNQSLLYSMQKMQENLARTIYEISTTANEVDLAAAQITAGHHDLAKRTETQATSLEQTASAMNEIASTTQQNTDNAQEADQVAGNTVKVAENSGQAMQRVVQTMQTIRESADQIVGIIDVIDSIAFQTNILALNAAVEAARAGNQGRGFAVVASEVRTLAQRSATAAQEIKELIEDSVQHIANGDKEVKEAGDHLNKTIASIRNVTVLMHEITSATQEQSVGINQIGDAIAQLDTVTQQNAELVEEAVAAADSLKHQANALARSAAQFNIEGIITIEQTNETSDNTEHAPPYAINSPALLTL